MEQGAETRECGLPRGRTVTIGNDENFHYLDCGDSFTDRYIYQNFSHSTLCVRFKKAIKTHVLYPLYCNNGYSSDVTLSDTVYPKTDAVQSSSVPC